MKASPMHVLGIAGWSGSGKTTLIETLLPCLIRQGVSVSTIKHTHHGFDIDRPGKDSFRHREAGAHEVMIASGQRWALQHEFRGQPEPEVTDLLARMAPVDLVLIEGFKRNRHPKIEVYRPALGKAPLFLEDESVIAIATDVPDAIAVQTAPPDLARLDLNDPDAVAGFILTLYGPGGGVGVGVGVGVGSRAPDPGA